jgi:hypothetical protein
MPVREFSAAEVGSAFARNPAARWNPRPGGDAAERPAQPRLAERLFAPYLPHRLPIGREDRLFAIGSCFARGIEQAFLARGFRVESAATEFDGFEVVSPGSRPLGFTNKYNPLAILNELRWALEPGAEFTAGHLIRLGDGRYVDPHANPVLAPLDLEHTLERRRTMIAVNRRLAGCRIVVITLGLVEAWHDHATGTYLNSAPPAEFRGSDRFSLHVLDFDQVRDALAAISGLLAGHGHPDTQIVVTVSPIPLAATFAGGDVVIANTHSKALLRAAAEEWSARRPNVHYFPSYEIIMNSDRAAVWEADGRHVRGEMVGHIMKVFLEDFAILSGPAAAAGQSGSAARE